ncbi:MAG: HAMP domain-containing sensor histidine kinase, partial [Lachnospiraceae bacterium]|nr:HAMP domain-containing sensor histidine kinase [Lachnospiraceae bacterium]
IWDYQAPDDIPQTFSLTDINSMSRWYLNDYPLSTWNLDNRILVACYPKNSLFRYDLIMPLQQMMLLTLLCVPCGILIFSGIFIFGTRWDRRQKQKQDQARIEWIAGVSHDIRTPLTSIIGYAEQLEQSGEAAEGWQHPLSAILDQAKRIRLLVEDFNLVNKLDYGIQGQKEIVKINAVLRRAAADLVNAGLLTEAYDIELSLTEDASVRGDEKLLYRLFYNLILNSIRHNPGGCQITVSLRRTVFHRITIIIADNGCGYPASILKKNKQTHNPWASHGLGLFIVSKIVQSHHGRLKLSNQNGAAARVTLPAVHP